MENFKPKGFYYIRKWNAVEGNVKLALFFKLKFEIRIGPIGAVVGAFKQGINVFSFHICGLSIKQRGAPENVYIFILIIILRFVNIYFKICKVGF